MFLPWVPELPVLGFLGRCELGVHFVGVMLLLDSGDLVDVSLRNKPLLSGVGVAPTATTAAGPAMASTSTSTTACDGGELSSLSSSLRFLAALGGHVKLHYAVKVRKLRAVDQNGIPSSV